MFRNGRQFLSLLTKQPIVCIIGGTFRRFSVRREVLKAKSGHKTQNTGSCQFSDLLKEQNPVSSQNVGVLFSKNTFGIF
jgi:hypothetical protein